MSRETDSSSSGSQGRGGSAYPAGSAPYGAGPHPQGATPPARAPEPEEPKTETTLTTRIRINIPGSRPIPPVVVRKPMGDTDGAGVEVPTTQPTPPPAPAAPEPTANAEAGAPSNWFAPRKAPTARQTTPSGYQGGSAPAQNQPPAAAPAPPATAAYSNAPGRTAAGPAAAGPTGGLPDQPYPPVPGGGQVPAVSPGPQYPQAQQGNPSGPPPGSGSPYVQQGPTPPQGLAPNGYPQVPGAPGSEQPAGPTTGPAAGRWAYAPKNDADTAALTPQWPGPSDRAPVADPTSGTGPLPPAPGPGLGSVARSAPPSAPQPAARPQPAPKKGRSKPVLALVGVFALAAVAYGAGLLLNHSDVPKGTTVLGVDIGGGSKEEAVAKMNAAFGKRATAPLTLTVGEKQVQLKPPRAGLSLDSQETVREAAGSDYNPVSVIGSLFGGERVAEAVIHVDEEKLQVALQDLAGTSATSTEGTIRFEPGKAVAVPGTSGQSLDIDASLLKVRDAYRTQVRTGRAGDVSLPVIDRDPVIDEAELDRAMKDFAEPAMSGLVTIKAGDRSIPFGPAKSLPKILGMKVVDGKLVETYDLEALKELYGNTFDGVLIERGTGDKTAVTPQDVAGALGKALRGKTALERIGVIETNPS
ncbi:hypothetical protein [Streptomyces sp. NPDC006879]|uniref:hypothetical protein n=1 Tax=Streptomyces sp. NPDC006879 TaxID=3364767 RepID=UPI003673F50C